MNSEHDLLSSTYTYKPSLRPEAADTLPEKQYFDVYSNHSKRWTDYACCICFPCLPLWARSISCFALLLIIGFVITAGALMSTFKIPRIDYNGSTTHPDNLPAFQRNGSSNTFTFNMGLKIGVMNPNVENLALDSVKAVAYYINQPDQTVGGGEMYNLHLKAHSITNVTFPFQVVYDPSKDKDHEMLRDIVDLCISPKQNNSVPTLTFHYDLMPVVKIISLTYQPIYHQVVEVTCPVQGEQLLLLIKDMIVSYLPGVLLKSHLAALLHALF
ncbi:hypothetical protein PHYBLDRAFT_145866 [Phycomyces blakesleeanus NRRL 1555(-)]|uniref:Late embryogenesis abundant protein LEA-2 subgroup domain-containing protein n=2 Tax=Phycomyces blakesleeanus TaxID=4837 RepID=A0A167MPS9_PHYB8|nr:hypothetical protein PHYBLDRAFT_145866 [Phycomyces blakesleeanus NRRL 1555(-)]OAD73476.1 hypothetical protein PHYBLDRAFT_145866 [Phycomyces blakesleeanus NRRL 1555(-)]|eukprot:XP_018291516.1 hypothetical protein PHYBLDRAFT_145866 [Phycomyces blakesleeanus NRRL 1555(-)]